MEHCDLAGTFFHSSASRPPGRFSNQGIPRRQPLGVSHAATVDVSVVLCTYNRCTALAGALESIASSEMPPGVTWEILVVDNNSADQTRQVVRNFCKRYPGRVRYVLEPRQGLSHARNTGIEESRGELLAFTDDDVTVEPAWLRSLLAGFRHREWAGVGGRILPAQKLTPPAWLPHSWKGIICAHFDVGDNPVELTKPPFGANMAFRRSMFVKYGGFRTDLGRNPGDKVGNEDTEFGRRLMSAGERLQYRPDAVVYHPIVQERVTRKFILSWWFDFGRAIIRERGDRPDVCGIPRDYLALVCRLAELPIQTLRAMCPSAMSERFDHKCQLWKRKGQIAELRRRLANRRRAKASEPAMAKR